MVKTWGDALATDSDRPGVGAFLWLRFVDGVKLSHYDWAGALVALCGMLIIVAGWGRA